MTSIRLEGGKNPSCHRGKNNNPSDLLREEKRRKREK